MAGKFDSSDNFSISIDHDPQVISGKPKIHSDHIEHIKDWIKMNHENLHSLWKNWETADTEEELGKLKKV